VPAVLSSLILTVVGFAIGQILKTGAQNVARGRENRHFTALVNLN
jgi:hypothetical protein